MGRRIENVKGEGRLEPNKLWNPWCSLLAGFIRFSELTASTSLNSIDQLIVLTETCCVFFEEGTELKQQQKYKKKGGGKASASIGQARFREQVLTL